MQGLFLIAAAAFGYLLGSVPFGLLLTRAAGLGDVRQIGSGNIGATNVLRTGRKDLAVGTLLLDGGKAAVAVLLARHFGGENCGFVAGAAAFVGHCWPVWLQFKGGKGVATFFGALLAALPFVGLLAAIAWVLVAATFRLSSLAALCAAAFSPVLAFAFHAPPLGFTLCLLLALLIFWRHSANILRLAAGEEPRIGEKKPERA